MVSQIKSLRLSLALMVLLIPIIAAGNLIPQQGRAAPWDIEAWSESYPVLSKIASFTGFDHVYTSWWFLVVFGVLFANMSLITWDLAGRMRIKARGLHRFGPDMPDYFSMGRFSHAGWGSFESALRKRRYNVSSTAGEIYARKGWLGIWGGTILHVGLVVMLSGAVLSGLFRCSGYVEVGEGQGFMDTADVYIQRSSGPLFLGHRPEVGIVVKDIQEQRLGKIMKVESTLELMENGVPVVSKRVLMNDPLYYRGMKVFQSRNAGPAVLFGVSGHAVPVPFAGYVNLKYSSGQETLSVFPLTGTPFQGKLTYMSGSEVVELELHEKDKLLHQGEMKKGQSIHVRDYTITFAGINKWSGIILVYDWAVPIVFAGFALVIAGIAVMGLFDPREIWARAVEGESGKIVEIVGWGRWKNMFHDEFYEIAEGIEEWKR